MADNERVEWNLTDIYCGQKSEAQENREYFTPGKRTPDDVPNDARKLEMNWPQDFHIPTGNPVFDPTASDPDNGSLHQRVIKTNRNIVCDQVLGTSLMVGVTGMETDYQDMAGLENNTGQEGPIV